MTKREQRHFMTSGDCSQALSSAGPEPRRHAEGSTEGRAVPGWGGPQPRIHLPRHRRCRGQKTTLSRERKSQHGETSAYEHATEKTHGRKGTGRGRRGIEEAQGAHGLLPSLLEPRSTQTKKLRQQSKTEWACGYE